MNGVLGWILLLQEPEEARREGKQCRHVFFCCFGINSREDILDGQRGKGERGKIGQPARKEGVTGA
jgi:hypothetical protein